MTPHATPEIFTTDLTQAALFMACWGSPDLPLIDAPPPAPLFVMEWGGGGASWSGGWQGWKRTVIEVAKDEILPSQVTCVMYAACG